MATGYYLAQGDKTVCGGVIIEGCEDHTFYDRPAAREGDNVTCGKHPGLWPVVGGIENDTLHGRRMAGTLDSVSGCPCRARFIPSLWQDTYEKTFPETAPHTTGQRDASSPDDGNTAHYSVIFASDGTQYDRPGTRTFSEQGETT